MHSTWDPNGSKPGLVQRLAGSFPLHPPPSPGHYLPWIIKLLRQAGLMGRDRQLGHGHRRAAVSLPQAPSGPSQPHLSTHAEQSYEFPQCGLSSIVCAAEGHTEDRGPVRSLELGLGNHFS